jgi:hypothetical protein
MSKESRLRRVVPGASDATVAALAARPSAEVDVIVAALRQARRDEREHQAAARRQRKIDAARFRHYDSSELAARNVRLLDGSARRAAAGDLEALGALALFARHVDAITRVAVDGLRAQGVSDALMAQYLGVTRQAVRARFPRQASLSPQAGAAE